MEFFAPHVQRPTRLLCLVLSAFVLVWLPVWWSLKLAGLVLAAAVFGSYREAWITQERICRQRTVGFIPGKIDQWKRDRLRGVEVIEEPEPPRPRPSDSGSSGCRVGCCNGCCLGVTDR
jgi:hypothetical protein